MALSATATMTIRLLLSQTTEQDFGDDVVQRVDASSLGQVFTSGTGANQANCFWVDERTITEGENEVLNVYDDSLTNGLGLTVAISKLKGIYVKNTSDALTLSIGGGTTPVGFLSTGAETIDIPPGGTFLFLVPSAAGLATSTNCNLKFAASEGSGTLTYDVAVVGVDAT